MQWEKEKAVKNFNLNVRTYEMAGYIWAEVGWYYRLYPKDIACYCVD